MTKIAVIEPTGIDISAYYEALPQCEIIEFDSRTWSDEKLIEAVKECNILALSNRPLSAHVIQSIPNLKFIAVAFSGIDHVDAEAVKAQHIILKNAVGYANTAVAELVMGFMISLARNIPLNNMQVRHGGTTNLGIELKDKYLGIIGLGSIGSKVAELAKAFEMKIISYDVKSNHSLEDIFALSDFVTVHIPLTPQTKNMINIQLLKLMKKSAYIINCARGPIINADDLLYVLENKMIAGAALDVFEMEPPLPNNYPLLKLANVIATPHIGYDTQEACVIKGQTALNNIVNYLSHTQG
jgi:phosphoglycerate dehydrogenase-like enzyme